jgi:2-hydroxy-6-oxonona-2,4-dienedioate hydrolase
VVVAPALATSARSGRIVSRWTEVGGLLVHARVSVCRPRSTNIPIVLVHGLVSSRHMLPAAEELAPFAGVWAPDLPGFGRSAKPSHVLDVPALADALGGWMDAAELDRAAFVANSFGCQVVVDLAVRHAARVERIVLNGPTIDPQARSVARQVGRWLLDGRYESPSLVVVLARDYRDAGARRLARTFGHALRDPIAEKLPRVRAPALVVRGGRDPIVPQRWAEEATRLLPSGRLVVVPGVGHAVNYTAPRELARVVLSFLHE